MNTYAIVRQEHLNHYGFLFGGAMLKWVDEYAWLVASRDFPGCPLVTVAMDKIGFHKPVLNGSILRFNIKPLQQGNTSIQYQVVVYADAPGANKEECVFSMIITFAHVNQKGSKQPLPRKKTLHSEVIDE